MSRFKLDDLLPAPAKDEVPTPAQVERTRHDMAVIRKKTMARLVAQEYVRNGMDLVGAYNTVNQTNYVKSSMTMHRLLGKGTDEFVEELERLVKRVDIDRDRALGILWSMVNASILDFMDDHGNVMSVKELKKLPRVLQQLISKIDVQTKQEVAIHPQTKQPLLDDMGRPYLITHSRVRIEIPDKMTAMRQLAEIMRWVGPATQINNFIDVGAAMAEADARTRRMGRIYEGVVANSPE